MLFVRWCYFRSFFCHSALWTVYGASSFQFDTKLHCKWKWIRFTLKMTLEIKSTPNKIKILYSVPERISNFVTKIHFIWHSTHEYAFACHCHTIRRRCCLWRRHHRRRRRLMFTLFPRHFQSDAESSSTLFRLNFRAHFLQFNYMHVYLTTEFHGFSKMANVYLMLLLHPCEYIYIYIYLQLITFKHLENCCGNHRVRANVNSYNFRWCWCMLNFLLCIFFFF